MLGVERAVWHCHTSDSQQRSAPEAGETNVQVIAERALTIDLSTAQGVVLATPAGNLVRADAVAQCRAARQ